MALTTLLLTSSTSDLPRLELPEEAQPLLDPQGKINPLVSEGTLSERQVVVSEEKSLPVFKKSLTVPKLEKIAFSSKSNNLRDAAIALTAFAFFVGVLGLVNPLFLVAALVLVIAAVVCGVKSKSASSAAEEAKSQLRPIYQDQVLEEVTPPQEAEFEKLLLGETVTIEENGRFTPDEFHAMMNRNSSGVLDVFSSYIPVQPAYPYAVPGVKKNEDESAPDAIFKHFAKQAVGLDNPELIQKFLGLEGNWIQNRARHICGFLKLLGDGNNPVNAHITLSIAEKNQKVALDTVALKTGRLTTFCTTGQIGDSPIMYDVRGDEVGLYSLEDFGKPQAERQLIARYKTSRSVTVFPPDLAGNVRYTINRTFTKI
jgi:hypothetical protein